MKATALNTTARRQATARAGDLPSEVDAHLLTVRERPVADGELGLLCVLRIQADKYDAFLKIVRDCPFGEVGKVTDTGRIVIKGQAHAAIDLPAADAKAAWQKTFDW